MKISVEEALKAWRAREGKAFPELFRHGALGIRDQGLRQMNLANPKSLLHAAIGLLSALLRYLYQAA